MPRIGSGRTGRWACGVIGAAVSPAALSADCMCAAGMSNAVRSAAVMSTAVRSEAVMAVPGPLCSEGCPAVCMVKIPKSSAANSSSCRNRAHLVPDMRATLPPPGI